MSFRSQDRRGRIWLGLEDGHEGGFWEAGDTLVCNLGASYTSGSVCENLSSYTFIKGIHFFVFITPQ